MSQFPLHSRLSPYGRVNPVFCVCPACVRIGSRWERILPSLSIRLDMTVRELPEQGDVTRLLHVASRGDADALKQVLGLLHERLRLIARLQLAGEADGHTLETDGLVHEAFLRLEGLDRMQWRDRSHVLAMAARTMRRVLVDYAEQRRAQKRGGGEVAVPLEHADAHMATVDENVDDLAALDEALARLALLNPRHSQIVECRFFVGLSIEETAETLELSPATVKRDWTAARAWLNRELSTP